jgi:hypothetical protein
VKLFKNGHDKFDPDETRWDFEMSTNRINLVAEQHRATHSGGFDAFPGKRAAGYAVGAVNIHP